MNASEHNSDSIINKCPKKVFASAFWQLTAILLWGFLLLKGPVAFADFQLCLYARSNKSPVGGHSFVTVEEYGSRVRESYGFWPPDKHPGSIAINKASDVPMEVILKRKNVVVPEDFEKMIEASLCQTIPKSAVARVRQMVQDYQTNYGRYSLINNNCTHFAIRIYRNMTRDPFPVLQTPMRTQKLITKITENGFASYSDYKEYSGSAR